MFPTPSFHDAVVSGCVERQSDSGVDNSQLNLYSAGVADLQSDF